MQNKEKEKILNFSASMVALFPAFIGYGVGGIFGTIASFFIFRFFIKAAMRG